MKNTANQTGKQYFLFPIQLMKPAVKLGVCVILL